MDERLKDWHPGDEEVAAIIAELRPLIRELAERERALRMADTRPVRAVA